MYEGYFDDPRNTDNAWVEVICSNVHEESPATSDITGASSAQAALSLLPYGELSRTSRQLRAARLLGPAVVRSTTMANALTTDVRAGAGDEAGRWQAVWVQLGGIPLQRATASGMLALLAQLAALRSAAPPSLYEPAPADAASQPRPPQASRETVIRSPEADAWRIHDSECVNNRKFTV